MYRNVIVSYPPAKLSWLDTPTYAHLHPQDNLQVKERFLPFSVYAGVGHQEGCMKSPETKNSPLLTSVLHPLEPSLILVLLGYQNLKERFSKGCNNGK